MYFVVNARNFLASGAVSRKIRVFPSGVVPSFLEVTNGQQRRLPRIGQGVVSIAARRFERGGDSHDASTRELHSDSVGGKRHDRSGVGRGLQDRITKSAEQ